MNGTELRKLLGARDLTIDALRAKDPQLADQIVALVRQDESARLIASLDVPDQVRSKLAKIDFTKTTGDVVGRLRTKLVKLGVDKAQVEQLARRLGSASLGLQPGQLIGSQPAIAQQIAIARVNEVNTLAGLRGPAAAAVSQAAPAPSALDDATLTKLVADKKLTDAQAKAVGLSTALYELVNEDTALATAIRAASFIRLGGKPAASTADLAKLSPADWSDFIASNKVGLAAGATPASMGRALAMRFAAVHPGPAFGARLPAVDVGQVSSDVGDLGPLFSHNPVVVGSDFGALDTTGLSASQVAKL